MKSFIHIAKVVILAIITTITTGCSANVTNSGGGGRRSTTTSVSRSVTAPAAGPVRIEPNSGSWDGTEKAAAYARSNGWHGPIMFKPCKMGAGGKMGCDSDLEWMTEQQCSRFFLGLGKNSPYCGAVWVKGSAATVAYNETVPVESAEEGGGGDVTIDQRNDVKIDLGLTAIANGAFGLAGQLLESSRQGSYCPPRMQRPPQQRIPACPRCGVVHPGRPCQQQGGGTINRNIYRVHNNNVNDNYNVNNAPRGYQPPQRYNNGGGSGYRPSYGGSQSRPYGNGSNNSGYGAGNPGLQYY
jgi:hypothetical protein